MPCLQHGGTVAALTSALPMGSAALPAGIAEALANTPLFAPGIGGD